MRIGLYGLPTAGKTFILNAVRNLKVFSGSSMLKELAPDFHFLSDEEKKQVRKQLAIKLRGKDILWDEEKTCVRKQLTIELKEKDNFIMDGHYSFGNEAVFTDEDGALYDAILYLYVDPFVLRTRMENSVRNKKYLKYDIESWQMFEVESLRKYCHEHKKDFYVLDNPEKGYFSDISMVLEFIDRVAAGYSCLNYAKNCVDDILNTITAEALCLSDGDKTLIMEDSSSLLGYHTHIFDGNFYTGFQAWRHAKEMADFLHRNDGTGCSLDELGVHLNPLVMERMTKPCIILTTGHYAIWKKIADKLKMPMYCGEQMSAETKYFITKFLQEKGVRIVAYGDSMNDYYMLKQADEGYVITKSNGTLSRSLKYMDMEGMTIV